jgi:hypothetical protein
MDTNVHDTVWVFNGEGGAGFPSGLFASRESAEQWILQHKLTGVLTEYPVGMGIYDWALQRKFFVPKRPDHFSPRFIGSFSSAHLNHVHFQEGVIAV